VYQSIVGAFSNCSTHGLHDMLINHFSQCADNTMDTPHHLMDRRYCEEFASRITNVKFLPVGCQEKYSDIVMDLKRRDTDTTHPTQFLS
jgi:hypothetical protein